MLSQHLGLSIWQHELSYFGSLNAISLPSAPLLNQDLPVISIKQDKGALGFCQHLSAPLGHLPLLSQNRNMLQVQPSRTNLPVGKVFHHCMSHDGPHNILCSRHSSEMKLFVSQLIDCSSATSKSATSQHLLLGKLVAYEGCPHMGTLTPVVWYFAFPR